MCTSVCTVVSQRSVCCVCTGVCALLCYVGVCTALFCHIGVCALVSYGSVCSVSTRVFGLCMNDDNTRHCPESGQCPVSSDNMNTGGVVLDSKLSKCNREDSECKLSVVAATLKQPGILLSHFLLAAG